jgi:hypothetical protein
MHLPSPQQAVDYFAALGMELAQGKFAGGRWRLSGPAIDWRSPTFLEIWLRWLTHAAHVLRDEEKLRRFSAKFKGSPASERRALMDELDDYFRGNEARRLSGLFVDIVPRSIDDLPRNWRARLARNLHGVWGGRGFRETVFDTIGQVDEEALLGWEKAWGNHWIKSSSA